MGALIGMLAEKKALFRREESWELRETKEITKNKEQLKRH